MALIVTKFKENFDYLFYELADERTRDWFPSAWLMLVILPFYIYFSLSLGPRLMRDIKPFNLRSVMFVYNIFQIFICIYILNLALKGGWLNEYNYWCQPIDWTENPVSRNMVNAAWWYTVVKLIDMLDTVFFVLRKKDRQISPLHVFHHSGMPLAAFVGQRFFPTGHITFVGLINSAVHIIMYTYYLIAGLGPKYQKSIWWKKYLTILQIMQFCIVFLHNIFAIADSSCNYPKWISMVASFHSCQFVYLFGKFYYHNYVKPSKRTIQENSNVTVDVLKGKSKIQ